VFVNAGMSHPYRVYVPSGAQTDGQALPLVVLLHGCTQTATDFALGTAMNQLAEETRCVVLYPEQLQRANSSRCWNWFEPHNQKRGSGEPGMIAALTRQVMATRNIDASRVYITGLSAGGAMAAVVAGLYPDIFAAVGVHSGLPCGAAHDIPSAFSAMRSGAPVKGTPGRALPTIVFHGTADKTVHPDNGENIANAAVKAVTASGITLAKTENQEDGAGARTARLTRYTAPDGTPWIEHWEVASGPHGWSGGDTAGSYTDPTGPSASAAMLEFFLQHRLAPVDKTASTGQGQ
jgi:poly(hydroxyalkanoate) depolymerase family esterase